MTAIDRFVARLGRLAVRLWLDGDRVRCSAPRRVLTPALGAEIAARREDLLAYLREERDGAPRRDAIVPVERHGDPCLSHGQERLWRLREVHRESPVHHVGAAFRVSGTLDVPALRRALAAIQRRHEILRTRFPSIDGVPVQRIDPPGQPEVATTDLRGEPESRREQALIDEAAAEIERPFDLAAGPLWRCRIVRLAETGHALVFTMHHLVFDGASQDLFFHELGHLYAAGSPAGLPALPVQYADFAAWQRRRIEGDPGRGERAYWSRRLQGVAELRLPTDHPRPANPSRRGASVSFTLPRSLSARLADTGRREDTSLFTVLLAAFAALLNRSTGQTDIAVCSPVAGRNRVEIENLVGYFNNLVVLRADLSGDPALREVLTGVRRAALEAHDHQEFPFQELADVEGLARTRLTRALFAFRNEPGGGPDLRGLETTPLGVRRPGADFDLAVHLERRGGALFGVLDYDADRFEPATASRIARDFRSVLERLAADPAARLSALPCFGVPLPEIAAALDRHPQIDEAAVVYGADAHGRERLVAHVVPNQHDLPAPRDLRRYLHERLPDHAVPRAFVPVAALPRSGDGSIDEAALAARRAPSGAADRRMPRTPLEERLAAAWARVLWLDREVGIDDDFFDLGGHSLLAATLICELEKVLERTLPLRAIRHLGSVADLVRILDAEGAAPDAGGTPRSGLPPDIRRGLLAHVSGWRGARAAPHHLMVGLNAHGRAQPLFWCLQGYHELRQLARYLGPDQPTWGMRSGHRVMEKTQVNIDALAAHYVDEILAVQPRGPFLVGGNCQAAKIAFQAAVALRERGHEITLLALQEKFVPRPYHGRVALLFGDESTSNPYRSFRHPETGWRKYYSGEVSVHVISGRHGEFFREPNIQVLARELGLAVERARAAPPAPVGRAGATVGEPLPATAYRAGLAVRAPAWVAPGAGFLVRVGVTNESPVPWPSTDRSGVALANRWFDERGVDVCSVDGSAALPAALPPGGSVELDLLATAPAAPGRFVLELDMVDEGVAWFGDEGSRPGRLPIEVRGAPPA